MGWYRGVRAVAAAWLATGCGGAGEFQEADLADAESVGEIAQALTVDVVYSDDTASPVHTQVKVCMTTTPQRAQSVNCMVDAGFALVGGGAKVIQAGMGALLLESRPQTDDRTWFARSSDHIWAASHNVVVYAVGLRLDGVNAKRLRNLISDFSFGAPIGSSEYSSAAPPPGRFLSVGLGTPTVTSGRFITKIFPNGNNWWVGNKDHLVAAPTNLSFHARVLGPGIIEGFGAIDLQTRTGPVVSTAGGAQTSSTFVDGGWALVGYGGKAEWPPGSSGRMLDALGLDANDIRRAAASSRDHQNTSGGSTTVVLMEARLAPGSHGLCNPGTKLSPAHDSCVATICATDTYCCNNWWDLQCINEVQTMCGKSCASHRCTTPSYSPGFWNDTFAVRNENNCYNYATNTRTDTRATPGLASGQEYGEATVSNVKRAAINDGLIESTASAACTGGRTKVAMVIKPTSTGFTDPKDHHWYRRDASGTWSHKQGSSPATNLDAAGQPITNPETAARGLYTQFGGYFCVCSDSQQGQGHAEIQ
jgi:hypothetical protein